MTKCPEHHVIFPQNAQRSSSHERKAAFRGRAGTPYPVTPNPKSPNPNVLFPDTPYLCIRNPNIPNPGAGAGAGAEPRSVCELAAESDRQEWLDGPIASETAINSFFILGPHCTLNQDTKYTQSSGPESDAELRPCIPKSPLLYHFPYSIPVAPLKTYDPAQNFTYPFSFPRLAINKIFGYAKYVALKHYKENNVTYTNSDGSQYSVDCPEMAELIRSSIESAKERALGWLRGDIGKECYSGEVADIYQDARAQPRLCAMVRREAIRAVDEAFKEIDRRVGILDLKNSNGSLYITEGKHLSRLPFSFDYPRTRSTVASSNSFPCLCKEGFAHKVCTEVLSAPKTGLERTNMDSVDAERWEDLDRQFRHNLTILVPEAMVKALREIAEPADAHRCCGWNEKTHVQPWMENTVRDLATAAADMIRHEQFLLQATAFGLQPSD